MQVIRGGWFRTIVGILAKPGFQLGHTLTEFCVLFLGRLDLGFELKDFRLLTKGDGLPHFASGTENNKVVFGPLGKGFEILFWDGWKVWWFHTSWYRLLLPVKSTKFPKSTVNGYIKAVAPAKPFKRLEFEVEWGFLVW